MSHVHTFGAAKADAGTPRVSIRAVALPVEHGAWGFLAESLVVGLVVAPSVAAACLVVTAFGAFLARHPAKLLLADAVRRRVYPRTPLAAAFAAAYALPALGALAWAALAAPHAFWMPLVPAALLAAVQLVHDVHNRGRELLPELAGSAAPGAVTAAMFLAGGFPAPLAAAVWFLLFLRAVSSVLFVRARLRLDRGVPTALSPAVGSHGVALALALVAAVAGAAPWVSVAVFAVLAARAIHGLSSRRRVVRPQVLGLRELGLGLASALVLALGYRFGG